jgi:endonuclease/exonuclease/phosphatase (EEP) superfamily protein YafD
LNWNIKKGALNNWFQDLEFLSRNKELILIQEARDSMHGYTQLEPASYWTFAPGFRDFQGASGVATLSTAEPVIRCRLTDYEPWLRTPKTTNITGYALSNSDEVLLVVNIHMINFTLGQRYFRRQLESVVDLLKTHQGPIIVSGDFNTWRAGRQSVVEELLSELDIQAIHFDDDQRVRFGGLPVDHIYIGGLRVQSADTHDVDSSDHNPMTLRLSI